MYTVDTPYNILVSFAYMYTNEKFTRDAFFAHRDERINLMVDSGAFTLHNAQQERSWLNLDTYCKFLQKYGQWCEKYVQLDVVGNEQASKRNYEEMVRRGLKPMYVLTMFDKDWSYFRNTMNVNPHCCIAGGVTTKGDWVVKRFQDAFRHSNEQAKIHGLGYVTYPKMLQLPLYSVDSSSWSAGMRYGTIPYFNNGIKGISLNDVKKGTKVPLELRQIFSEYKITPKMFMDRSYHTGTKSIGNFCSILAWLRYQEYCYRHGLRLFLAIAQPSQLVAYLRLQQDRHDMTYQDFRNYDNN